MSIGLFTLFFLLDLAFWLWIVRWGGAEWLEGTFLSGFIIHMFAPRWSAEGIKGSRKNKFVFLRVKVPVQQGAKAQAYRDMSSFRNAAGRDGLALKNVKLFLREP